MLRCKETGCGGLKKVKAKNTKTFVIKDIKEIQK